MKYNKIEVNYMAYRFYIFKEKLIISFFKTLSLLLLLTTIYIIYIKKEGLFLPLIIANLVLIVINTIIPRIVSNNVEKSIRVKGNFILDSNNNGYIVDTFASTFIRAIIMMVIIILLIYMAPLGLKEYIDLLDQTEGLSYLFLFVVFYNILIINGFISNITLKSKQNKIFARIQNKEIPNNIKTIERITAYNDKLVGLYLGQEMELLFNTKAPEFKYLIDSLQRNYENNIETATRDNVYGGINYNN